jgi:hypothetical protein
VVGWDDGLAEGCPVGNVEGIPVGCPLGWRLGLLEG